MQLCIFTKGKEKNPNVVLQYVLSRIREATHICLKQDLEQLCFCFSQAKNPNISQKERGNIQSCQEYCSERKRTNFTTALT